MGRKFWMFLWYYLILSNVKFHVCKGNDFDDGNCKEYKMINEASYDRSPDSLDGGRPLGFMSTVIKYNNIDPTAKNPCFSISLNDSAHQTVEVLAISFDGNSVVCLKSQPEYNEPTCQSGIRTCTDSAVREDKIKFVFYCEGCEAVYSIWFRITVSPSFEDPLDFEEWCARDVWYPNSLITVPNVVITAPMTTPSKATNLNSVMSFPIMLTVNLVIIYFQVK
ncbi:uncharacterized protein LOC124434803 isoform X1 [Xenia sp. Carnegie-2017]|uniref:uncharacterized protein LOC124434803 isoform X1 n=1 Tax=Xenia sp. Carnegie-2017 TaxID=2897299 RepID=UPI001F04D3DA|nr:uncharacterized protein LOC124434803 isoform X1 [Xenia sp. Carnegie-2017]